MIAIPDSVLKKVMAFVFAKADEVGYLTFTKPQSGVFMDSLVKMPEVGGVLASFMEKGRVKTYIKDAILHDYTDTKKAEQVPTTDDFIRWCQEKYNMKDVVVLDNINKPWTKIMLLVSHSAQTYFVVVDGSYKQWGTAMQKALEYMVGKPFANRIGISVRIVLSLYCKGTPVSHIEKANLSKALEFVGGAFRLYGQI